MTYKVVRKHCKKERKYNRCSRVTYPKWVPSTDTVSPDVFSTRTFSQTTSSSRKDGLWKEIVSAKGCITAMLLATTKSWKLKMYNNKYSPAVDLGFRNELLGRSVDRSFEKRFTSHRIIKGDGLFRIHNDFLKRSWLKVTSHFGEMSVTKEGKENVSFHLIRYWIKSQLTTIKKPKPWH